MDREKVIRGLHCCANIDGANCGNCPYDMSVADCTAQMSMDVLELLKEQEQKPVIQERQCEVEPNVWERKGFCPKCHQIVRWSVNRSFCGFCGQEVKWDG